MADLCASFVAVEFKRFWSAAALEGERHDGYVAIGLQAARLRRAGYGRLSRRRPPRVPGQIPACVRGCARPQCLILSGRWHSNLVQTALLGFLPGAPTGRSQLR